LEDAAFLRERLRSREAYLVAALEAQLDEELQARAQTHRALATR
jgi:hypothetical protein